MVIMAMNMNFALVFVNCIEIACLQITFNFGHSWESPIVVRQVPIVLVHSFITCTL